MFITNFCKKYWPIFIILSLEVFLFATNYIPNTYFLGWDNLFPEINFLENIKRNIFGVWLEYRGLGLMDGMSFAANLPHHLFLLALSFFLPQNFLRYFFILLIHLLGGVGVYFLLCELFEDHTKKKAISLCGSLFYLFNLITVQTFFAPYEVFTVHYAFLPLLILGTIRYLKSGSKKDVVLFSFISSLSIPQAHVPTLFIVYIFTLVSVLYFQIIGGEKAFWYGTKETLQRSFIIIFVTFIINSYWGLPYFYSALHNSRTIADSKINIMSTEDIYLRNKAFGNFTSVALMKGFSLDYVDLQPSDQNDYMMSAWREYVKKPLFVFTGYLFFTLAILGLIATVQRKNKRFYPFVVLFVFTFLMLGTDIPILGAFSGFFYTYVPYFFQIFRFTFTKFSILYAFSFSILLGLGLSLILDITSKIKKLTTIIIAGFLILLGYYSFPSWRGNFLYQNLKVKISQDYFALVDFFNGQDRSGRIATLPQPSFWGWTYTNWGYKGSGFIWYGLPQPTMDGAFYPWSRENENYYWEITQAIYSDDIKLLRNDLEKYQISWVVVDHSFSGPPPYKSLYIDKLEEMIRQSNNIRLISTFGKIAVYQIDLNTKPKDFIFLAKNLPQVSPAYIWNNSDQAYQDYGNYILLDNATTGQFNNEIYFPYCSLFTGRKQDELEFKVEDKGDSFSFKSKISKDLAGDKLIIPPITGDDVTEIDTSDLSKTTEKYPQILLDGELVNVDLSESEGNIIDLSYIKSGNLEIRIPKIWGYYSYSQEAGSQDLEPKNCDQFNKGLYTHERGNLQGEKILRLISVGSSNCLSFDLPNLSQRLGYLVSVASRNILGKSLNFSVINKTSDHADIETTLPQNIDLTTSYFVMPPMEQYGRGYTLYFDNQSYGRNKTINDLGRITVNPIPYKFLTGLKIVKDINYQPSTTYYQPIFVDHPNPSFYQVSISNETMRQLSNVTMVLSQSFDSGWHAYEITNDWLTDSWYMKLMIPLFAKELKNHILVNNWENGWNLSPSTIDNKQSTIIIIYLPQYLEYLGFVLLFGFVIYLLLSFGNSRSEEGNL